MPLDRSLTTLAELAPGDLKRITTEVLNSVKGGSSLADTGAASSASRSNVSTWRMPLASNSSGSTTPSRRRRSR